MNNKIVALLIITLLVTPILGGCQKNVESKVTEETTVNTDNTNEDEVISNNKNNENIAQEYQEIASYLKNISGVKLPYFGGYELSNQQIVIVDNKAEEGLLWRGSDGSFEMIKKSEIPEDKLYSSFSDGEFRSVKTTFVMQEDGKGLMAFILAIHEGYHFYGQEWVNNVPTDNYIPRGTVYPENVEARVLMNNADKSLMTFIEGTNPDGASEALYFINKVRKEHNEDLDGNLNTAIAEGSANFIENIYVAIAKNPKLKFEMSAIAKKAYDQNKSSLNVKFHDKASEYYKIASLPMFYFAMEGNIDIFEQVKKGEHPLELLKEITKEKPAELNEILSKEVLTHYIKSNKMAASFIEKFKENSTSKDYTKLLISTSLFPGSMQFGEFINYKNGDNYATLNTMTTAKGQLNKGSLELIDADTRNSEDYQYYILYVKTIDIKKEKTLTIESDTVKISGVSYQEKENGIFIE